MISHPDSFPHTRPDTGQRPARRGGCKAPAPWGAGRALPGPLARAVLAYWLYADSIHPLPSAPPPPTRVLTQPEGYRMLRPLILLTALTLLAACGIPGVPLI